MNGCELLKCKYYNNGKCTSIHDTCIYQTPDALDGQAALEERDMLIVELQAKLAKPIAEHPDVQRLVGQVVELQAENAQQKATISTLERLALEGCAGHDAIVKKAVELQAENERLKKAVMEIKANSYPGLAVKESTLLNIIYKRATKTLKGQTVD